MGPLVILLATLILVILCLALLDIRKPPNYPPGPGWIPVLGSVLQFTTLVRRLRYTHLAWQHLVANYGPLVGMRLGRDLIVLVSGYPLAREVLTREDCEGRPDGFLFRLRAFGKRLGVVFTDGQMGQEHRRFILKHLREFGLGRSSMEDRIADETKHFIAFLFEKYKEGPVDVRKVVNVCVLNNLWGMLTGQRFSITDSRLSRLLSYIHQSFSMQDMSGGLLNQLPFIRHIAPERSTYNKNIEILTNTYAFISETIEEHKKTLDPLKVRDFVDAFLLEMKRNENNKETSFTEEQLLVLLLDLFMAGSDSTSNTLGFALLYLLHFPREQDKLAEEMDRVTAGRVPTLQDRHNLPYTDAFIMEVLRFTNVATVSIPHRAKQRVHLGSFVIPKDTTILVNLYSVHMDESHWGDPGNFRPERFINSDGKVVQDEWLMPFGLGRRRCLGETLARPMLFLFLTALLSNFRVSLPPGQNLPSMEAVDGAILSPAAFTCQLTPRHSS